jgi:H+/Cl- antiporter ClcA
MQDSDPTFDLVVETLEPWATRVEQREVRRRHVGRAVVFCLVLLAAGLVLCAAWLLWRSTPPPSLR